MLPKKANKYIITHEQLERVAIFNMLLAREIMQGSFYQQVEDSTALMNHLHNTALQLIESGKEDFQLPVAGGYFVWVSPNRVEKLAAEKQKNE